ADIAALQESGEARAQPRAWAYEDLLGLPVRLLAGSDAFVPDRDGTYQNLRYEQDALKAVVEQAPLLRIAGIIRETDGNNQRRGGLYYTRALTDLVILRSAQSPVVLAQQAREEVSVLTGLHFAPADDAQKAADLKRYYQRLTSDQQAEFSKKALHLFPEVFSQEQQETEEQAPSPFTLPEGMSMEQMLAMLNMFTGNAGQEAPRMPEGGMELLKQWSQMSGITLESIGMGDSGSLSRMTEAVLNSADESTLARLYDQLVQPEIQSLEATYRELGRVNLDMPASITLYMDTFEQKETITRLIQEYNSTASEEDQIAYTDFVALMISGVTNIVNVISYVLIAFVAVSLVVSSIMIGIITYISVLERTKEIGILRSVGASRKDVGRVFTAEAFIIGLAAGALGILISALLIIPINQIIYMLSNDASVKAILPPAGALILIGISALLSLIAGFLPSRIAAKKDPVACLRAE
ncbi:MAG: ABC transporter permease, partial [Clostridiales bacterium]|nr:ABC transporter permease [Clostridiales bacterium]